MAVRDAVTISPRKRAVAASSDDARRIATTRNRISPPRRHEPSRYVRAPARVGARAGRHSRRRPGRRRRNFAPARICMCGTFEGARSMPPSSRIRRSSARSPGLPPASPQGGIHAFALDRGAARREITRIPRTEPRPPRHSPARLRFRANRSGVTRSRQVGSRYPRSGLLRVFGIGVSTASMPFFRARRRPP